MPSTFNCIATTTLTATASSITFSSIPNTYTDIIMMVAGNQSLNADGGLQFNNDTGTNYSRIAMYAAGGSPGIDDLIQDNKDKIDISYFDNTYQGSAYTQIFNYTGSSRKSILNYFNARATADLATTTGTWENTAVINTITYVPGAGHFNAGMSVTLYGIKSA